MQIFKNPHIDYLRWKWPALALSAVIIVAGLATIFTRGIPMGIEFAGGTAVVAGFEQDVSLDRVRDAVNSAFGSESVVHSFGDPAQHQIMIRVPQVGAESGTALSEVVDKVTAALQSAGLPKFDIPYREAVGPAVGQQLRTQGFWAAVLALGGILLYITFRYQFSFAVGAIIATIHDLLVTLAFLAFFQYDLTLNVIAALLTIAGFSSNDTIVIFDRVRENLRGMRRDSLKEVLNLSVNQTMSRTIITSGTAMLSAIALYLFGGDVLRGFAFTLIVGMISGTYSTIFIAIAVVSMWRGAGPLKAAVRAPAAPRSAPPSAPQQPTRKSKPQRKARAS
jgi:preprotein translocase subunit SecF